MILVTDRVREGNLGMVTTFCHHDQAKVEVSEVLSALCQCDLLEPSVVVVRRFTNSPYLPWGSFGLLYLGVITFSRGASSAQFPLDQLCLCRQLPYFSHQDSPAPGGGRGRVEGVSLLSRDPVGQLLGRAPDVQPYTAISSLVIPHPSREEGSQTEERSDFHPAL